MNLRLSNKLKVLSGDAGRTFQNIRIRKPDKDTNDYMFFSSIINLHYRSC